MSEQDIPGNKFRWLKYSLYTLGGVILTFILAAVVITFFFEDKIKQSVVGAINSQLNTKVEVKNINFSLLSKFPKASVEFTDVYIHSTPPFASTDTLAFAKQFFLMFNVFDLFGSEYKIHTAEIKNACIYMKINKAGVHNFDITKKTNTAGNDNISVQIKALQLTNVLYDYDDKQQSQKYALLLQNGEASLGYANNTIFVEGNTQSNIYTIQWNNNNYIDSLQAGIKLKMEIASNGNKIIIRPSQIETENMTLQTQGQIDNKPKSTGIQLSFNSKNANLLSLLKLVPSSQRAMLLQYDTEGNVTFDCKIAGDAGAGIQPDIDCTFNATDATVFNTDAKVGLQQIKLKGAYSNHFAGKKNNDCISIKEFSCKLNNAPIKGQAQILGFDNTHLIFNAEGRFDLAQVKDLFAIDTVQSITGQAMAKIKFDGFVNDKSSYNTSGNIEISQAAFQFANTTTSWKNINAMLLLNDNTLQIEECSFNSENSDFSFKGYCENFPGCIFTQNKNISIQSSLTCNMLNLDEFIITENSDVKSDTAMPAINLPAWVESSLMLSIKQVSYKKFSAKNVVGNIDLMDKIIFAQNIRLQAFGGVVMVEGKIDASNSDHIIIACDAGINKISIKQLFTQTANFGQKVITDNNLNGIADATVQLSTWWSPNLEINMSKIMAVSDVTINNGELNNFEPLQALKKYVKGADFKNIKFETLENQIEIKDGKIIIPNMEIRSTAMNLYASGTHTFTNEIDYKIKMQLSEVLGRKVKNLNTEFGIIVEDGLGKPNIFVSMKGPIANPVVKYDRKAVESHIAQSAKQEKQNLKVILNKEFGLFKKDSTVIKANTTPEPKKKKQELIIDTDPF